MTDTLAVIVGKLSAKAIRLTGAGLGSNVPGRVSRAISGSVLANLARQARKGVVAVSGTNGKSTTSGFISSILSEAGFKLAHNRQGANLVPGITASLIDAARWDGRLDVDYCLFETDEAALPLVAKEVKIDTIVVTNLFRDQLDRFGELDTTASLIAKGISLNNSRAILNADDPNVAQLAKDSDRFYYGIMDMADTECGDSSLAAANAELSYCGACGSEYLYDAFFYGQLGHYRCSKCDNRRPQPHVFARNVRVKAEGSSFELYRGEHEQVASIEIQLPGLFNVYNALAAAALAFSLGINADAVKNGLQNYTTLFGRSERLQLRGKTVLIQLIKNPAGASQAVRAAVNDPKARLLIAINDNYADGRDVSWLWDADFEQLSAHDKRIVVSGQRCYDMAVRCKYAGVSPDRIKVVPSLEGALLTALEETTTEQTLWLLPTYTCLLELQKIVRSLGYNLSGT
jgi:UDP-N-acetylmuramyl tripeptide synthase